ncbi:hypothetical protein KC340_g36 [Hortaea werneckii]|nr:hypothetical protein KC340_g36 [Hortaea werneckii]
MIDLHQYSRVTLVPSNVDDSNIQADFTCVLLEVVHVRRIDNVVDVRLRDSVADILLDQLAIVCSEVLHACSMQDKFHLTLGRLPNTLQAIVLQLRAFRPILAMNCCACSGVVRIPSSSAVSDTPSSPPLIRPGSASVFLLLVMAHVHHDAIKPSQISCTLDHLRTLAMIHVHSYRHLGLLCRLCGGMHQETVGILDSPGK